MVPGPDLKVGANLFQAWWVQGQISQFGTHQHIFCTVDSRQGFLSRSDLLGVVGQGQRQPPTEIEAIKFED